MTTIDEMAEAFDGHGALFTFEITRAQRVDSATQQTSIGVLLVDGERFVAVEAGLSPDGTPNVTLSSFDENGDLRSPTMFDLDGSVMFVP